MRLRLLCCDVFLRCACYLVSQSKHIVDVEFVPMLAHTKPDELRAILQERIDAGVQVRNYDALLLGYGLCGNTTAGLTCDIPMIIPRVHDCCAVFLGSADNFAREMGDAPSMRWCSCGYYERGHLDDKYDGDDFGTDYKLRPEYLKMIEDYGEDNADYIWETLHPKIETEEAAYIQIDGFEFSGSSAGFAKNVEASGAAVKPIKGDLSYLKRLIDGPWDTAAFLTVPPGKKITPVYDMENVYTAR